MPNTLKTVKIYKQSCHFNACSCLELTTIIGRNKTNFYKMKTRKQNQKNRDSKKYIESETYHEPSLCMICNQKFVVKRKIRDKYCL